MVVDGLAGAMARVSYEGKTGYMFDGYLVDVIMPIRDETAEHYVGRLRSTGREAIYEKHTVDYGNYFTDDEAIHIASMTWPSSFLIASKLFLMPLNIPYPPDKGVGTKTTTFPADVFGNSTGDLETVYDDKGNLKRIAYYFRGGAGGYSVTVEPSTQNGYAFKISRHDFAD